jgi:hypothetical protein
MGISTDSADRILNAGANLRISGLSKESYLSASAEIYGKRTKRVTTLAKKIIKGRGK